MLPKDAVAKATSFQPCFVAGVLVPRTRGWLENITLPWSGGNPVPRAVSANLVSV